MSDELDIVDRLRGKVRVPVNDGAGPLNGQDFFERTFPASKTAMEAADEIERLRKDAGMYRGLYEMLKAKLNHQRKGGK